MPGDFSSAAFWLVAAAALPGSRVEIEDVGLNPTRTALLDVLRRFGARVDVQIDRAPRPASRAARVTVEGDRTGAVDIAADEVPGADRRAAGNRGAGRARRRRSRCAAPSELRVKESDRIAALVAGFRALGIDADERPDGFISRRPSAGARPSGGVADARGDHRMAMAFAIAALAADGPSTIDGADAVAISYPGFFDTLAQLAPVTTGTRDRGRPREGDKIYLVGFMGAGKTTLARALATRLDWRAVDIDELIETARATDGRRDFREARRAVFPRRRAARAARSARRRATSSSRPAAARSSTRRIAPRSTPTASSVWLDVPLDRLIGARAGRRPPAARRRSRGVRTPVSSTPRGVRAGARPARRRPGPAWTRWSSSSVDWLRALDALSGPDRHSRQPRGARDLPRRRARPRATTQTLVLGDLVGYGADPNAVIDRVRRSKPIGDRPRQSRQGGAAASSRPKASTRSREERRALDARRR